MSIDVDINNIDLDKFIAFFEESKQKSKVLLGIDVRTNLDLFGHNDDSRQFVISVMKDINDYLFANNVNVVDDVSYAYLEMNNQNDLITILELLNFTK